MLNENHKNSKHQKPNLKQNPMTETQNSKQAQWSPRNINLLFIFLVMQAALSQPAYLSRELEGGETVGPQGM
jgi:hypothetical protein